LLKKIASYFYVDVLTPTRNTNDKKHKNTNKNKNMFLNFYLKNI